MKLYMFRTVPLSIIRSSSLYTQQWYMSLKFADSLRAGPGWNILILLASCPQTSMIYHCCVYSEKLLMIDRGTLRNMQSFISKNKFEKLVHTVGFIIRNLTRCTVTWTSNTYESKWRKAYKCCKI